jgi:hypothetical protein
VVAWIALALRREVPTNPARFEKMIVLARSGRSAPNIRAKERIAWLVGCLTIHPVNQAQHVKAAPSEMHREFQSHFIRGAALD